MANVPNSMTDEDFRGWAREHLLYEARMLAFAAARLFERRPQPPDQESNAMLESFAVHVRCLDGFLWGQRTKRNRMDAFAADFCAPGEWRRSRAPRPAPLVDVRRRDRLGREVVHLSYHRSITAPTPKTWPVGQLLNEILYGVREVTTLALPARMDQATREALRNPMEHSAHIGPASVATGMMPGVSAATTVLLPARSA